MDRRQIEHITASLAVVLLFFMTIGALLFSADLFFGWDIFSPDVEKVLGFILVAMLAVIVSSVLVNVMINLSIIALNSETLVKHHKRDGE